MTERILVVDDTEAILDAVIDAFGNRDLSTSAC
jgi:hypothetical protein